MDYLIIVGAIKNGQPELLRQYLPTYAAKLNDKKFREQLLYLAVLNGNFSNIKLLVDTNQYSDLSYKLLFVLLQIACHKGDLECFDYLIAEFPVQWKTITPQQESTLSSLASKHLGIKPFLVELTFRLKYYFTGL